MKYDYGDAKRGLSFEHTNFYQSLERMGHEVIYFDFMTIFQQNGKLAMSKRLLEIVQSEHPDLLFCVLFTDQFEIDTIRYISEKTNTSTFNWFCDDHWRFDNYSKHWAPAFNWVSTTAASAVPKYEALGYRNVIKTQWACNHYLYRKLDLPLTYDVTFVGQPHGTRRGTIDVLRKAGINVRTWGYGWETGRLEQDQMIEVFNQSRINLNLSNASSTGNRQGLLRWLPSRKHDLSSQIKGRNFEVPGCGGFLLTDPAENLQEYYEIDREIGIFASPDALVDQIRHYMDSETERSAIAAAGYERTVREHTYERRFNDIFSRLGLLADAPV